MSIEFEVFNRSKPDFNSLINYGFIKENKVFFFEKNFLDNTFKAIIKVDESGIVVGKIIDLMTGDEYTNIRIENNTGKFVSTVRNEYINILKDIKEKCFVSLNFLYSQTNRIANYIKEKYGIIPEFLWEKFSGFGVFRNKNNKWFGAVMNIDRSKLDTSLSGEVEIINLKIKPERILELLNKNGFYKAYHMNKKDWISVVLDETLSDTEIELLIDESYNNVSKSEIWIVPANPKYYDVINAFNDTDIIFWKQSSKVKIGDIVYLYIADPYSCIMFKCKTIQSNIPFNYKDDNVSMSQLMNLKLEKKFSNGITFKELNKIGIKAIRGPRRIDKNLSEIIDKHN